MKTSKTKTINKQQGSGIVCPICNGTTHVVRTNPLPDESIQERFRVCDECGKRFITQEQVVDSR